jgi:hypothetical protein
VAVYRIDYTNRIVSTFDSTLNYTTDRNVGDVKVLGVDAQIGQRFGEAFTLTASVSYNDSELLDDVPTAGVPIPTKGKTLVETPEWMYALRADMEVTPDFKVGLQGKKVGDRFGTDLNTEVAPAYTVFDLDMTYGFSFKGVKRGELLLNVTNLLDEKYFGNISSGTGVGTSVGFYSIGAPRTIMGAVRYDFLPRCARHARGADPGGGPRARRRCREPRRHRQRHAAHRHVQLQPQPAGRGRAAAFTVDARRLAGARRRGDHPARAARHPAAAGIRFRRGRHC